MDCDANHRTGHLDAGGKRPFADHQHGRTTEEVSKSLLHYRGMRVVTDDLSLASILSGSDDAEVIVASGLVRKRDRGIVGEATIDLMRQSKFDIDIVGVSGIEADGTLLDYDYHEVRVTQAIMAQSRQVWLMADHTKFGRHALVRLGSIAQGDKFFTDLPVPGRLRRLLRRLGWK